MIGGDKMLGSDPVRSFGSLQPPAIWTTTEQNRSDGDGTPRPICYYFLSRFLLCNAFIPNLLTIIARQADNWCFESLLTGLPFLYVLNKLALWIVRTSQFSLNNEKPSFIYSLYLHIQHELPTPQKKKNRKKKKC